MTKLLILLSMMIFHQACSPSLLINNTYSKKNKINYDLKKIDDVFKELENKSNSLNKDIDSQTKNDLFTKKRDNSRYKYLEREKIFYSEKKTPYKSLKEKAITELQKEVLGMIRTELKATQIIKEESLNENYNIYTKDVIKTQVEGVLSIEYFKYQIKPNKNNIKPLDTLKVVCEFDEYAYYNKLKEDKEKNEQKAKESFVLAKDSFDKGKLYNCIEKLTLTHFYIYNGGHNISIKDDKYNREEPIIDAMANLVNRIGNGLKVQLLDEDGDQIESNIIHYKRSMKMKLLNLRLVWDDIADQDIGGIKLNIYDKKNNAHITEERSNEIGEVIAHLTDYLKENKEENIKVKVGLSPRINISISENQKQDWYRSEAYRNFTKAFLENSLETGDKYIHINHLTFPQQKIIVLNKFHPLEHINLVKSLINNDALEKNNLLSDQILLSKSNIKLNEFHENIENDFFYHGDKFFTKIEEISNTVSKEIEKAITKNKNIDDNYGLDGVVLFDLEDDEFGTKFTISFYKIDDFNSPLMKRSSPLINKHDMNDQSDISYTDGFKDIINTFLDVFFYRTIPIKNITRENTILGTDITISNINDDGTEQYLETLKYNKTFKDKNQSRYHNIKYLIESKGYRSDTLFVPFEHFSFDNRAKAQDQISLKQKLLEINLKKASGSVQFHLKPDNMSKFKPDQTEIKFGKRIMGLAPKWDNSAPIKGKMKYTYTKPPGNYIVKVKSQGFEVPRIQKFEIKDSDKQSEPFLIHIQYKSKLKALARSTVIPGWGHFHMDQKSKYNLVLPAIYFSSIALTINNYKLYNGHKESFILHQNNYKNSKNSDDANNNKVIAQNSWSEMEVAKNWLIGSFVSTVCTNIVTSIYLWFS